jgi:hypothetical protein
MGEWRYSSTILDLGTGWRWTTSFTPRPLYPQGKGPQWPLNRRLGGPQSWSGRGGEEIISCPFRKWKPGRPARSPSLYPLSYPGSLHGKLTVIVLVHAAIYSCCGSQSKRKCWLVVADMFWIIVSQLLLTPRTGEASERPHIVFILADDVVSCNWYCVQRPICARQQQKRPQ